MSEFNEGLDFFSAGNKARTEGKHIDKAEWVDLREKQPESNNPLYFFFDSEEGLKIHYTNGEEYKWTPSTKQEIDVDYFVRVE